jgi:hypothetical protein
MFVANKLDYLDKNNEEWKKTELVYQKAVAENDKDTIFKCFHRFCHAYVCSKMKNLDKTPEEIQDIAIEATIYAMDRRDRFLYGGKMAYGSLGAWCSFAVREFLYSKQRQFDDSIQFDDKAVNKRFKEKQDEQ